MLYSAHILQAYRFLFINWVVSELNCVPFNANIGNVAIIMTDANSLPAEMHFGTEDTMNSQSVSAHVFVWWVLVVLDVARNNYKIHYRKRSKSEIMCFSPFHFRFSWNENCFYVHRCVCVRVCAAQQRFCVRTN